MNHAAAMNTLVQMKKCHIQLNRNSIICLFLTILWNFHLLTTKKKSSVFRFKSFATTSQIAMINLMSPKDAISVHNRKKDAGIRPTSIY